MPKMNQILTDNGIAAYRNYISKAHINRVASEAQWDRQSHACLFLGYMQHVIPNIRKLHRAYTHVGKQLQKAEGIVEGLLMALDVRLEIDRLVRKESIARKVA